MALIRRHIPYLVGALIAVLLQLAVAPYITIGFAMCNFVLCYTIVLAIVRAGDPGYILAFILGLIYDFASSEAVGAMAFICVLVTFAISRLYTFLNNDSIFIPIALVVAAVVVSEMLYGVLMIACGLDVGFLDALVYRILPCSLYDIVISLVILPIATIVFGKRTTAGDLPLIG